jgi:predicted TIM-barrel fold metal-dependent hydrolase
VLRRTPRSEDEDDVQNIHAHAWDQALHMAPETVREADLSRGFPLNLTVDFDTFMADMEPFDRVAVFGLKARQTGYWVPDQYIADFVAQAPDTLVGFAACDPTQEGSLDELRHGIEDLGLVGLKMGPMYAGFDPRDERCAPVYRYCEERGIPILFHTGTTFNRAAPLGFSRPWLFDDVAIRYPELRMVLAHVGHPFMEECLVVIRKHLHVYADISALYYRPWQFYNMLIAAQEYRVTHKLLFGTDYPFASAVDSIDGLRGANAIIGDSGLPRVSAEVAEAILARDSFHLLGLS